MPFLADFSFFAPARLVTPVVTPHPRARGRVLGRAELPRAERARRRGHRADLLRRQDRPGVGRRGVMPSWWRCTPADPRAVRWRDTAKRGTSCAV